MKRYLQMFFGAILAGIVISGGFFWANSAKSSGQALNGQWLTETYFVRGQVTPDDLASAARDFKTVVDLRPDGESPGQSPSSEMAEIAKKQGMAFHYVPVSPGAVPDEAVAQLGAILKNAKGPVLLYCRSGSRAARTWALAEASRTGGDDAPTILRKVQQAGFGADDLKDAIAKRIAARK